MTIKFVIGKIMKKTKIMDTIQEHMERVLNANPYVVLIQIAVLLNAAAATALGGKLENVERQKSGTFIMIFLPVEKVSIFKFA